MKLSTKSRYSVRLMFDLALHNGSAPLFLKDIAQRQNISEKYLSKLIIPLKNAGLVFSERGAHGGYTLAKKPEEVTIREIFEIAEGKIILLDCLQRGDACEQEETCPTRGVWEGLGFAIKNYLENITLQNLIEEYNSSCSKNLTYNI